MSGRRTAWEMRSTSSRQKTNLETESEAEVREEWVYIPCAEMKLSVSVVSWRTGESPESLVMTAEAMADMCCTGRVRRIIQVGGRRNSVAEAEARGAQAIRDGRLGHICEFVRRRR